MRVLLDSNIVLDVLLKRDPRLADAQVLWQAVDEGRLTAYLPASSLADIYYVARRMTDMTRARQAILICLDAFEIGPVDRSVLERAQALSGSDFEDNVLIACAELNELEAIVTRDPDDFAGATVSVWSPEQCRTRLETSG